MSRDFLDDEGQMGDQEFCERLRLENEMMRPATPEQLVWLGQQMINADPETVWRITGPMLGQDPYVERWNRINERRANIKKAQESAKKKFKT